MSGYIVHKAVEFEKITKGARTALSKSLGVLVSGVDDLSDYFTAQRKHDGVHGVAVLKGNGDTMLSRTGEIAKSCDHILRYLKGHVGKDYVVLGEVWHKKWKQSDISGTFRRHSLGPELTFAAFDMLTLDEFSAGESQRPFKERYAKLHSRLAGTPSDPAFLCATYNPGTYGSATGLAADLGSRGPAGQGWYDGLILRDPEGLWRAGSGTAGEIIKVKPRASYDVRVLGLEEGKGKNAGTPGSLRCQGPEKEFTVRGCVTDDVARAWWANPALIVGSIIEVECLGITEDGSLREPVMKCVRDDKRDADF
ncbi:ATP-dependent DNA ligase [Ralstonia phage BHDT_So9]|uniref:ATP-dependent DNA ligase n=1 Tax=Ralstonia phage BHDT_So9 TaxID=2972464 RepID=A0A9E7U278_9CAUD|nr:ATP-dependent DNA ligase [Ralstonia phage BHDT_So9]UWI83523.1 ATP-dependent DNA ligase [Ralstonia phage DLDT_So2]UZT26911.1 ATP-dependent DNA ligase [Ralstonia phage BHDTSo81]WEM03439.1 ATP-dependent DNA ligase [Ralstonia phage BHDT8]